MQTFTAYRSTTGEYSFEVHTDSAPDVTWQEVGTVTAPDGSELARNIVGELMLFVKGHGYPARQCVENRRRFKEDAPATTVGIGFRKSA